MEDEGLDQEFESERIRFVPITKADLSKLREVISNEDMDKINKYLVKDITEESIVEEAETIIRKRELSNRFSIKGMSYVMWEKDKNEIIGESTVTVNSFTKVASIGVWLRKKYWGQGYGSERAVRLVEFLFNEMGVNKVQITVEKGNSRAESMVEDYVHDLGGYYDGISEKTIKGKTGMFHTYVIEKEK